jgi:hypothetical protein
MVDLISANHTGRELALMLSGKKPLAMFYAEISELPDESLIPEAAFAPHVSAGAFVRGEITLESSYSVSLGRNAQIRYVFFAPVQEAWRITATSLLRESFAKSQCPWNEALERMEGRLLGYSDEEVVARCVALGLVKREPTSGSR